MQPERVLKFGGTSVGSAAALARSVRHVLREPGPVLVVLSAVGGVTDLLLRAGEQACDGGDFNPVRDEINARHRAVAADCAAEDGAAEMLAASAAELDRLLSGAALLGEVSARVRDELVSLGERTSVHLFAAALRAAGRPAQAHKSGDLGLRTDDHHGRAEPVPDVEERIRRAVDALPDDEVAVVTGFLGRDAAGRVTTLGRGGSDFSAALFGAALGVGEIQIWTDVPGILRADPEVVPEAGVVPEMCFEEAAELAFFGAKVLHPRTLEPARRAGIPIRVLGTFQVDPDDPRPVHAQGTLICEQCPDEPVRALALQREVQSLHLHSLRMMAAPGFLNRVFEIFARRGISVDVIATSEVSVSMTLDAYEGDLAETLAELGEFAEVERVPGRSILCLVGAGFRKDTGLLSRVFQVLAAEQVPVHVVSQGASRINITLVTEPPFGQNAMRALHRELFPTG